MRFAHPELPAWLHAGATVVTADPLLAAVVQQQHAAGQLAAGRRAWPEPKVVCFAAFLEQLWRDLRYRFRREVPVLLSNCQEQVLWEDAVHHSEARVLDTAATAQSALNAYKVVSDWQLPLQDLAWEQESDSATFLGWLREVKGRCEEQGWLLPADLPWYLSGNLDRLRLPRHIVFAGFQQHTKALLHLATSFERAGSKITWAESSKTPGPLLSVCAADTEAELQLAARWARARLTERPGASVALYVDDLEKKRATVERVLREVLQPAAALLPSSANAAGSVLPYHIHDGAALSEQPVIAAAFALLDFTSPMIPIASVSIVLNSPFFAGGNRERSRRAMTEARLCGLREMAVPLSTVETYSADCPVLGEVWPIFRAALRDLPKQWGEAAEWSTGWRALLQVVGWPGDQPSDLEQQAVRQWDGVLHSFAETALAHESLSAERAIAHLRSLASAKGPCAGELLAPVQVLEPQCAESLSFDFAWLAGSSELEWPPALDAPAYVPLSLQRAANVLTATATGRRQCTSRITEAVSASAPSVVVSYSGDQVANVRLSPMFKRVREVESSHDLHVWAGKRVADQNIRSPLEEMEDWQAPPVPPSKLSSGGTYLLRSQSQCPFQAFALWRLSACGLDQSVFSYDARNRGDFLHKALAQVWGEIRDSDRLHQLSPSELEEVVHRAVQSSLATDRSATPFRTQLRKAEAERLQRIILQWLEREKQRPDSFQVRDLEKDNPVQLGGLSLKLRTDRIDQLENGHLLVIDYKSGKVDRRSLDGERPKEPQLLVYAAMLGSDVDGLYFASVRRENGGPDGYALADFFDAGEVMDPADWHERLQHWTEVVNQLAIEYQHGFAPVSPLKGACDFCEMKPICRIKEYALNPEEAE